MIKDYSYKGFHQLDYLKWTDTKSPSKLSYLCDKVCVSSIPEKNSAEYTMLKSNALLHRLQVSVMSFAQLRTVQRTQFCAHKAVPCQSQITCISEKV